MGGGGSFYPSNELHSDSEPFGDDYDDDDDGGIEINACNKAPNEIFHQYDITQNILCWSKLKKICKYEEEK